MEKPYYSLDEYFKRTYGEKCYKIAIDAGLSCPNRDGTCGTGGCIFCSAGGSGDFAISRKVGSIQSQIEAGLALFQGKKTGDRYVAYYQAYTNTYGDPALLEQIYREGLSHPKVMGISIATRPDCLSPEILTLLKRLQAEYAPKFIWVELGLQTCHDRTARLIHRGYDLPVFETAMEALTSLSIPVIVHVILGLPGESSADMFDTIRYLNRFRLFGIKLQLLHILKGTALAAQYGLTAPTEFCGDVMSSAANTVLAAGNADPAANAVSAAGDLPSLHILTMEEYIDLVIRCLELTDPSVVIHRVTGDGPKDLTLAPLWSLHKRTVLNTLHHSLKERQTYQGRLFHDSRSTDTV